MELEHQPFQNVGLNVGARKSVEKKSVGTGIVGDGFLDDLHDDLVGNQAAGGDDALGFEAQFGFAGHFLAQQVPGGDVKQIVFLDQEFRLGSFAGTRRTEQGDIKHRQFFSVFKIGINRASKQAAK